MSSEISRVPSADADALEAVAEYAAARKRGEWRRLLLPGANLRDTDMSGLDLDECDLTGAVLDGVRFAGASLVRSCLAGASLLGADFSFANLDRADMEGADATAATFAGASLRRADLVNCHLNRADLSEADLSRANLNGADLTSANLSGALAEQANLRGATLEDAVLTAVRGEPQFDEAPAGLPSATVYGWPAARLTGPQLADLARLYLDSQGWVIKSSSRRDDSADLVVQRNDATAVIQVKATATPSLATFALLVHRFSRAMDVHPNAHLILVLPGPVPPELQEVAKANKVGVLEVWVERNTMRVEEIVTASVDPLRASA